MLGMVVGKGLGVSKKVTPVVVRVPRKSEFGRGANAEHFLEGVSMVNDAIKGDSAKTRAILSLSWYYDQTLFASEVDDTIVEGAFELWQIRLYRLLTNLIKKGVFVVTGSGNSEVVCYTLGYVKKTRMLTQHDFRLRDGPLSSVPKRVQRNVSSPSC